MHLEMSSAKCCSIHLCLNVLMAWCLMTAICDTTHGTTNSQWVKFNDSHWHHIKLSWIWFCFLQHIGAETKWLPFCWQYFETIFLNENVRILIKVSLKFVPKGPFNNIPSSVQIMAWRQPGQIPQAIICTNDGKFTDAYMRHSASMS